MLFLIALKLTLKLKLITLKLCMCILDIQIHRILNVRTIYDSTYINLFSRLINLYCTIDEDHYVIVITEINIT